MKKCNNCYSNFNEATSCITKKDKEIILYFCSVFCFNMWLDDQDETKNIESNTMIQKSLGEFIE